MLLGIMLRTRREELGASVLTMAARMEIPTTLAREWEDGKKPPRSWLPRIARAYKLPVEELRSAWEALDKAEVEKLARSVFE